MTDFLSDDARLDPRDTPADAGTSASGLDRRSFLRALSGSALTLVAGGLTVTLTACQGASGGGATPNTLTVPTSFVGPQNPASAMSSAFIFSRSSGSSRLIGTTGSNSSNGSGNSTSGTSSGSGTSGSSTSGGSASSTSSRSSSSVSGALRRAAGKVNGWSTRV